MRASRKPKPLSSCSFLISMSMKVFSPPYNPPNTQEPPSTVLLSSDGYILHQSLIIFLKLERSLCILNT